MSSVVISGDVSGSVTLQAPSAAGTTVLTLPATSGTVITGAGGVTSVASGGTGRTTNTAYAVVCGGTTTGGAEQSIASVGTSGQVLTSNGAGALPTFQSLPAGGVTSLNGQTGAITNTDYGAIGSYITAGSSSYNVNGEANAINATVAGSTLSRSTSTVADAGLNSSYVWNVDFNNSIQTSLGLSGTWRGLSRGYSAGNTRAPILLWVRIS